MQQVLLAKEQEEILIALVEAARSVPREGRYHFLVLRTDSSLQDSIQHPGLPNWHLQAHFGDLEVLHRKGQISITYGSSGMPLIDVEPEGFQQFQLIRTREKQPVEGVEAAVRFFLDGNRLALEYPEAFRAWTEAEATLWSAESKEKFTAIGHSCREALQHFCSVLVSKYSPPNVAPNAAQTVARLKAVVMVRRECLPTSLAEFLDALIAYWGTVSDLAQRQEHGAQKEGDPLLWEDARRVVFQTAILMFEVDRALSGT